MCSGVTVGSAFQDLVGGVGQGNKFVLLDMTEEPEAEKAYSIQHKRNLMER